MSQPAVAPVPAPWIIRELQPTDVRFVLDSWLRSARADYPRLRQQEYFDLARPLASRYLADEGTSVLIAADTEADWHIAGWLAHRGETVLYVYVKNVFRGYGCARDLWRAAGEPMHYLSKSATATKLAAKVGATLKEQP